MSGAQAVELTDPYDAVDLGGIAVTAGASVVAGPPGPPGPSGSDGLEAHIVSATPHVAYDDIPTLTLLFENGLI